MHIYFIDKSYLYIFIYLFYIYRVGRRPAQMRGQYAGSRAPAAQSAGFPGVGLALQGLIVIVYCVRKSIVIVFLSFSFLFSFFLYTVIVYCLLFIVYCLFLSLLFRGLSHGFRVSGLGYNIAGQGVECRVTLISSLPAVLANGRTCFRFLRISFDIWVHGLGFRVQDLRFPGFGLQGFQCLLLKV